MPTSDYKVKMIRFIDEVAYTLAAGESKEETCPVCNGRLFIEKSEYNGHLHADCDGCKFMIME